MAMLISEVQVLKPGCITIVDSLYGGLPVVEADINELIYICMFKPEGFSPDNSSVYGLNKSSYGHVPN